MLRLFAFLGPNILGFVALGMAAAGIGMWTFGALEARSLRHTIETLNRQIDDPKTGYKIRLSTCEANVKSAGDAVSLQNARTDALGAEGSRRAADAANGLHWLQARGAEADKRIAVLKAPLTAPDTCSRLLEIERRYQDTHR